METYYFELYQPESHDELQSFHEGILSLIHDHSEPYDDPLSQASYRSWVGLSYPKFGRLDQYFALEECNDPEMMLDFAIKHPGRFVGDTVHCVSIKRECLTAILDSGAVKEMAEAGLIISNLLDVPAQCQPTIFKRDRRPESRSDRYRMKQHQKRAGKFNLGKKDGKNVFARKPIAEPLPRFASFSKNKHRKPIHISKREASSPKNGWFSIYGLSSHGTTVPIIPIEITLFSDAGKADA